MEERFYYCGSCGNLFLAAIASGITPHCCGKEMMLLEPNTRDGSQEHHVPVVCRNGNHAVTVSIGKLPHPMTAEHNIRFVCVVTTLGYIIRYLDVGDVPEVVVKYEGCLKSVYAYCNVHGLWKCDCAECC